MRSKKEHSPVACEAALRDERRRSRTYRDALSKLTVEVDAALAQLDAAMSAPPSRERGKAIAAAVNRVSLANACAKRFGLGILS